MALAIRYANFDLGTGANDGTSEADAWQSWSAVNSGMAAGTHLFVKKTASRHAPGGAVTISATPTTDAPVVVEGYETTPGDRGRFEQDIGIIPASGTVLRNIDIAITAGTPVALETSTPNLVWENCRWSSSVAAVLTNVTGGNNVFFGCQFHHTGANNQNMCTVSQSTCHFVNCMFLRENATSSPYMLNLTATTTAVVLAGCIFWSDGSGTSVTAVRTVSANSRVLCVGCTFVGMQRGTHATTAAGGPGTVGGVMFFNCAFQDMAAVFDTSDSAMNVNLWALGIRDFGVTNFFRDTTTSREFIVLDRTTLPGAFLEDPGGGNFAPKAEFAAIQNLGLPAVALQATQLYPAIGAVQGQAGATGGEGGIGLAPEHFGILPISRTRDIA